MLPKQSSLYLSHPAALAAIYHVLLLPLLADAGAHWLCPSSQKEAGVSGLEQQRQQRPGVPPDSPEQVTGQPFIYCTVERIQAWMAGVLVPIKLSNLEQITSTLWAFNLSSLIHSDH